MDRILTHVAKIQLASSLRRRYQTATSKAKKQILSEFVAVSGYHPKYTIHLLNAAEPSVPARRGRMRPTVYDDAAKQALIVLWEASDRICGKRLKPLLRILLPSLERHGHLKLDEAIRGRALGEPERSARLTVWNQSRAICERYKALFVVTPALHAN